MQVCLSRSTKKQPHTIHYSIIVFRDMTEDCYTVQSKIHKLILST